MSESDGPDRTKGHLCTWKKNIFHKKIHGTKGQCDRFFSPAELKIRQFPTWNGNSPSLATSPPTILPCPRWWASGNAGIGFKSWKHGESVPGFSYEKATCLPAYHNSNYLCSQGRSYNSKKKKSHGADSKSLRWLKKIATVLQQHTWDFIISTRECHYLHLAPHVNHNALKSKQYLCTTLNAQKKIFRSAGVTFGWILQLINCCFASFFYITNCASELLLLCLKFIQTFLFMEMICAVSGILGKGLYASAWWDGRF